MTVTKGSPTPSPTPTGGGTLTLDQIQQMFGSAATSGAGAGKVYMGAKPGRVSQQDLAHLSPADRAAMTTGATAPRWMSTVDAENNYFTWNAKQRQDFIAKGLLSGLLTSGAGDLEGAQLWKNLVDQAANYGAQGQRISPMDILSGYVKGNSSGGWIKDSTGQFETNPATGERRYVGPKFKTTTQTNADLTDPATARAIATSVFQSLLGRDPGQGEIGSYAAALAQSEQENPSTTTTTTQYDPTTGEATNSSSVTAGGITDQGRQQLAADEIKKKAEYGATQASTTYLNALESAVKES